MDFHRYVIDLERARAHTAPGGHGAPAVHGSARPGPDNVVLLAETASTNTLARGVCHDLEAEGLDVTPTLFLALAQSAGRGRHGRTWVSPGGRGVYGTLVRGYGSPDPLATLPLLAGVGLCRALAPHLPGGCRLKWPNDLMVPIAGAKSGAGATDASDASDASDAGGANDPAAAGGAPLQAGRKIGGILIEALIHPGAGAVALVGFGVNHGHTAGELPPGATSLRLENPGDTVGLAELTWQLVAGLERELRHAGDTAYAAAAYGELSIHRLGDRLVCQVGDRRLAGTFGGFDAAGRLRLRHPRPAAAGGGGGAASAPPVAEPAAAPAGGPAQGAPEGEDEILLSAGEVIES